jgi:N6-L-threonylcarbamoyladenine synthase
MGVSFAKGLSLSLGCRLVGVDHLRAHLLAAGLERTIPFPCLGLLVSGGHTHLYHMVSQQEFVLLGRTLDDAAGEAFDKVARLLNLPYPGGVHVDRLARTAVDSDVLFPRPYLDNDNLDFSFSGLKTAVANHVRANPGYVLEAMPEPGQVAGMAAGNPALCAMLRDFNLAVAQTLRAKTVRALEACSDVRAVVVAGGVAANSFVREEFTELSDEHGLELVMPSPSLCTDNAAMIAHAGWLSARAGLAHGQDLEAVPRGRLVPWDYL